MPPRFLRRFKVSVMGLSVLLILVPEDGLCVYWHMYRLAVLVVFETSVVMSKDRKRMNNTAREDYLH